METEGEGNTIIIFQDQLLMSCMHTHHANIARFFYFSGISITKRVLFSSSLYFVARCCVAPCTQDTRIGAPSRRNEEHFIGVNPMERKEKRKSEKGQNK